MNINEILKYNKPKESYYDVLGCSQISSVDQINREYKIKALQLHPDKNPDPESAEKFRKIQSAKDVLTDVSQRKLYDIWLNSGINISFEHFKTKQGHSMHWAPARRNIALEMANEDVRGQGSERMNDNDKEASRKSTSSLLDRFRNYEI